MSLKIISHSYKAIFEGDKGCLTVHEIQDFQPSVILCERPSTIVLSLARDCSLHTVPFVPVKKQQYEHLDLLRR